MLESLSFYGAVVVQAVTEAFPISSSSHLIVWDRFFPFSQGHDVFYGALHLGTLAVLMTLFSWDIGWGLKGLWHLVRGLWTKHARFTVMTAMATGPSVAVGWWLHHQGWDQWMHSLLWISGINAIVFGVLMGWIDIACWERQSVPILNIPVRHGFYMGCAQALALIPGVSRLGICLTMGRWLGYHLNTTSHLSFVLGMPVMAGAVALKFYGLNPSDLGLGSPGFPWSTLGTVVAITYGLHLPCMLWFLHWCSGPGRRLWPFALYRIFLGLVILALA
jgi:undecaprenyl-diphosphatase